MKKIAHKIRSRTKKGERPQVPSRITNDTVALHREEILKGARKYIYPLQQTKHRLVIISISIFVVAAVAFFSYCLIGLYKVKSTSHFLYKVTQVIPFPIARIGSNFVSYDDYLFEVNHYTHYYHTQQNLDFNSEAGQQQLAEFKKQALQKVINDAYIKEIAKQKGITVSDKEVNDEIAIVRNQNRLGGNDKEFEAVLRDFWDWSVSDFKRSLKQQILNQKVVSALDTDAHSKADQALSQIKAGKDFAAAAKEYSEDAATKDKGGEYGFLIDQNNRDISPKTVDALFKLQPGQYSGIVDVGYGLEIVKNLEAKGNQIRGAHIVFNFKDINTYLNNEKDKKKTRTYVQF